MCKLTITFPFDLLTNVGQASHLMTLVQPARVGCYMLKYIWNRSVTRTTTVMTSMRDKCGSTGW